ncbi:hypothetical protein ABHF33_02515 [Chitinibacter sp. FCG-7]|uniref:PsiF repeat-containing protein n=1 Tax=Chitinibacter mangrovi TaxID=3153927 RepID=A0AAU7FAW1_9NEIS
MKKSLALLAFTVLSIGSALAAPSPTEVCASQAAEKKLSGAAKNSFLTKCEKDMATMPSQCEGQAKEKKLAGAAKNSFIKKCENDAAASSVSNQCEAKAKEKKLAGAAKNSFVSKCQKDGMATK